MDTKDKVLNAAEEIMAQQGLTNASISEIAKSAGITDSLIYQHFKGKMDILYTATAERIREILRLLNEHLQGIRDAESMLSKMVWFHLHYNHTHKGYIRLLLFECRSDPEFYDTDAYRLARKYAGIMLSILEKGVKDGVFADNMDMRIAREAILGALDFEDLSYLVLHETKEAYQNFDAIMSLILPMIQQHPNGLDILGKVEKQDKIIAAAEKVFAKRGFVGAKVAEIAKMAEVSEGTVFEYFQSKEELLFSIPRFRFRDIQDGLSETFEIKSALRKIRRLIRYHFSIFLTNRDFLKVFLRNMLANPKFYKSEAYKGFQLYTRMIEEVIEEGIEDGVFRSNVNPRIFRNLFLGAFYHMALRWFMLEQEGYVTDKMLEIDKATDLLCRSIVRA